jgi:formate hydrogenlyase subunit 3/multisubunit Na+/H+ antiporter MnhD subunit
MNPEIILVVAFGGAFITYLSGKISKKVRDIFAVLVSLALAVMVAFLYNNPVRHTFYSEFLDFPLILKTDTLSWFFAITIAIVGSLAVIFSLSYIREKERTDFYYLMILLVNAGMIGIVFSGDLISFYIFWEVMSWGTFLLISYNRGPALPAGIKYIVMSIAGSVAMITGMLALYSYYRTFTIAELSGYLSSASPGFVLFIFILFFIAFGIKNAVWPFHTWLPPAHSEAPSPFSAILSGILVRMGMYGFLVIFFVIAGIDLFLNLGNGLFRFNYILAWIGAINILIPTFIAMLQNDSKRLLAWHGVGQGGYMVLGIAIGSSLGTAGGIFHIINHTSYIALLFLVVGAIEYRTHGVRDLNSLGGLIKKMPVTFIGALVGACGLIGIPLTNGFVSKWLIYNTLILDDYPFLAFAALLGTWGTILSLFKFLHNIFLGQLPKEYRNIKEVPFGMQFPILFLSLIILVFGIMPGIPLKIINQIIVTSGLEPLNINIWGISSDTGVLNTVNIFVAVFIVTLIIGVIFRKARKGEKTGQEDNYAAGAPIPEGKYHYTVDFYNPLNRIISPYLKDFIDDFYMRLARSIKDAGNGIRRIYTGDVGYYTMYIILFLALLIFVQINWALW